MYIYFCSLKPRSLLSIKLFAVRYKSLIVFNILFCLRSVTAILCSRKHTRMCQSGIGASRFASSFEVACEDSPLLPSGEERGKTAVFTGYSQRGRRRCVLYLLGISVWCHFSGRFCFVHSCCTFVYCGVDNVDQFKLLQVKIGKPQVTFPLPRLPAATMGTFHPGSLILL